jgi:hypothetical protein
MCGLKQNILNMENFKYTLDKSSKKHICPICDKRTYVLYIDNETGNYIEGFGKCDRSTNCNYHKYPPKGKKAFNISFMSLKNISDRAYKLTDENGIISIVPKSQILEKTSNECWITEWFLKNSILNYTAAEFKYFNDDEICIANTIMTKEVQPKIIPSVHSMELLNDMYFENSKNDNLTEFMRSHFTEEEILKAKQNYLITGTDHFWKNSTAFWQIDEKEKIHACKIMLYDKHNGKRIKKPYPRINWLHNTIKDKDFNLSQCLFGLHRINEDFQKTIGIVESEKTAIILSIFIPEYIWLATGSKQNLKFDLFKPLKKRKIVLFPDKGEYMYWSKKAEELNAIGFRIRTSKYLEKLNGFEAGTDLADIYFSEKSSNLLTYDNNLNTNNYINVN